jgi:hypothetical protein
VNLNLQLKVQGFTSSKELCSRFVEQALSYEGLQAIERGGVSAFGARVGYGSAPWDGAFVDVVGREAGVHLPSCVSTTAALSEFILDDRVRSRPRVGDLAFFAVSTEQFGQPRLGIVVSVEGWETYGRFITIEGNTSSGLPRSNDLPTGVFRRTHFHTEVLAFARPRFRAPNSVKAVSERLDTPVVNFAHLTAGRKNAQIRVVQLALASSVGLRGYDPGSWCRLTASAFARYQRRVGFAGKDATGSPELVALERLAEQTGLFATKKL